MSLTSGAGEPPEVRISDAEREQVVELLRRHCADGRLNLDEFAERVGTVFDARTRSELDVVLSDLPELAVNAAPATPAEKERRHKRAVRWTLGILGSGSQKGRWRVEGETNALAIMGGVLIDLRQAEIEGDEVVITATAFMGGVDILVPEGVEVVMTGFSFMGSRDCKVKGAPLPGTPLVRVKGIAIMGGVTVKTRPPRAEAMREAIEQSIDRTLDHTTRHVQRHLDRAEQMRQRAEQRAEQAIQRAEQRQQRAQRRSRYADPATAAPGADPVPPVPPRPPRPPRPFAPLQDVWPYPDVDVEPQVDIDDIVAGTKEQLESSAAPDGTVTILITDIEGSSRMAEELGDHRWIQLLRRHNDIVRRCVTNHGGSEIKAQGDGFMIAFQSARRAVLCAISIQRAFEEHRKENPGEPIQVRIGLHTGEVVREADDVFGRNVILAARIAAEADGGEILVSSLVKELTDSGGDLGFDGEREVVPKGLSRPCVVYNVAW